MKSEVLHLCPDLDILWSIAIMKEFILSFVAGWIVGVLFGWLKLPLPAPPPVGFVGALGILFGAWSIEQLKQLMLH
jgi:XapX domain-containing protein